MFRIRSRASDGRSLDAVNSLESDQIVVGSTGYHRIILLILSILSSCPHSSQLSDKVFPACVPCKE
jgi:hypothetical protein